MRAPLILGAIVLFIGTAWADMGFDEKYARDYNIFNPINQLRPDNPLNPINSVDPKNPFNPINSVDLGNPANPINRYNPNDPFNPINELNPDNPLNPINRYNANTPFQPLGPSPDRRRKTISLTPSSPAHPAENPDGHLASRSCSARLR